MIAGRQPMLDSALPPAPPDLPTGAPVDQGPMRSDLLRQIALLEQELSRLHARIAPWSRAERATPRRGPALLTTADLERVRDELVDAIRAVVSGSDGPA